jgi:hypothetical protein
MGTPVSVAQGDHFRGCEGAHFPKSDPLRSPKLKIPIFFNALAEGDHFRITEPLRRGSLCKKEPLGPERMLGWLNCMIKHVRSLRPQTNS